MHCHAPVSAWLFVTLAPIIVGAHDWDGALAAHVKEAYNVKHRESPSARPKFAHATVSATPDQSQTMLTIDDGGGQGESLPWLSPSLCPPAVVVPEEAGSGNCDCAGMCDRENDGSLCWRACCSCECSGCGGPVHPGFLPLPHDFRGETMCVNNHAARAVCATNLFDCQAACKADCECIAAQFVAERGECWLTRNVALLAPDPNFNVQGTLANSQIIAFDVNDVCRTCVAHAVIWWVKVDAPQPNACTIAMMTTNYDVSGANGWSVFSPQYGGPGSPATCDAGESFYDVSATTPLPSACAPHILASMVGAGVVWTLGITRTPHPPLTPTPTVVSCNCEWTHTLTCGSDDGTACWKICCGRPVPSTSIVPALVPSATPAPGSVPSYMPDTLPAHSPASSGGECTGFVCDFDTSGVVEGCANGTCIDADTIIHKHALVPCTNSTVYAGNLHTRVFPFFQYKRRAAKSICFSAAVGAANVEFVQFRGNPDTTSYECMLYASSNVTQADVDKFSGRGISFASDGEHPLLCDSRFINAWKVPQALPTSRSLTRVFSDACMWIAGFVV